MKRDKKSESHGLMKFTPEQLLSYSRREVGELKAYISELEWKINKLEESNKALQQSSMFAGGNYSACIVKNGLAKISDKTIKRLSNELSPEERKEFRRSVKREELYRSQKEWIKKFKERIKNLEEENAALRLNNADLEGTVKKLYKMDRKNLEEANKLIKEIDELNSIKDFVGEGRPPRNINDEIPCISNIRLFLNHNESLEFLPR